MDVVARGVLKGHEAEKEEERLEKRVRTKMDEKRKLEEIRQEQKVP